LFLSFSTFGQNDIERNFDPLEVRLYHSEVAYHADKQMTFGTPAIDASQKRRELVWVKRISEMWDRMIALERGRDGEHHSGS
jgi:hypothetical protein